MCIRDSFIPIPVDAELAEVHILDNEEESRAYIDQLWAEAMTIYNSGNYKLAFSPAMQETLQVHQQDFMQEDAQAVSYTHLDVYKRQVFSGASVYLMLWSNMDADSIPLKIFVYGNPMYYWMNFCSCRTMGIIEHLSFYFRGGILLLIVGGIAMSKKEIK